MDMLLPWILQLHVNRKQGIQMVWKLNRIGRSIMCGDPFNLDFAELMKAIEDDSKMPDMLVQY